MDISLRHHCYRWHQRLLSSAINGKGRFRKDVHFLGVGRNVASMEEEKGKRATKGMQHISYPLEETVYGRFLKFLLVENKSVLVIVQIDDS